MKATAIHTCANIKYLVVNELANNSSMFLRHTQNAYIQIRAIISRTLFSIILGDNNYITFAEDTKVIEKMKPEYHTHGYFVYISGFLALKKTYEIMLFAR